MSILTTEDEYGNTATNYAEVSTAFSEEVITFLSKRLTELVDYELVAYGDANTYAKVRSLARSVTEGVLTHLVVDGWFKPTKKAKMSAAEAADALAKWRESVETKYEMVKVLGDMNQAKAPEAARTGQYL